jgi:hypothetical protein
VTPWDPAKEVEDIVLLTNVGDYRFGVRIGISVSGRWCCRFCAEIILLDCLIDPRCILVDISTVLYLEALKPFPNLEDVELQLWLVG